MSARPPYQPLAPRARPVVALLLATLAVDVAATAADAWQWSLLRAIARGDDVSSGTADASDRLVSVTSALQLLLLVAVGIAFLRWFKRAYDDVDALGAHRRFGTGWAIGAWFVPFLNLWRPKQIADDIWHASSRDREPVPLVVNWWWGVWIVSTLLDNVVLRTSFSSQTTSALFSVFADAADALAAVLAILVVRLLTARLDAVAPEPEPLVVWPIEA